MKRCTSCGDEKDEAAFGNSSYHKSGRQSACLVCRRKQSKEWKERNKQRVSAYAHLYQSIHKDRLSANRLTYKTTRSYAWMKESRPDMLCRYEVIRRLKEKLVVIPEALISAEVLRIQIKHALKEMEK